MPGTQQTLPVTVQPLPQSESRPNPDPTERTNEALQREINLTRERMHSEDRANRELIETRLNAMDKAIELLQRFADKQPTTEAVDLQVKALEVLVSEKFNGVKTQILERDARTEQTSRDNKVAIDAALQAQKEAVGKQNESNALAISKSEASFTKQIDQLRDTSQQSALNTDGKINDLKDRLTAIENRSKGIGESWGVIVAVISMVIAISTGLLIAFGHK